MGSCHKISLSLFPLYSFNHSTHCSIRYILLYLLRYSHAVGELHKKRDGSLFYTLKILLTVNPDNGPGELPSSSFKYLKSQFVFVSARKSIKSINKFSIIIIYKYFFCCIPLTFFFILLLLILLVFPTGIKIIPAKDYLVNGNRGLSNKEPSPCFIHF